MVAIDQGAGLASEGRFAARFARALREDRVFYGVIAACLAAAAIGAPYFGRHYLIEITSLYVAGFLNLALSIGALAFVVRLVRTLWRERPDSPLRRGWSLLRESVTPEIVAGLALYLALGAFMGAFTTVKTLLPLINPFWADPMLAGLDQALHFGRDPWRWLHPIMGSHAVTRVVGVLYFPVWTLLVFALPLLFCLARGRETLRRQALMAFLLAWIVNGTVVACLMMSGGPAFYGALEGDPARFRELTDYLAFDRANPLSASALQATMLESWRAQSGGVGVGISEFPSLHVTMATLCAFMAWRVNRWAGLIVSAFAAVIMAGSVHLAWHYAVGGYFGLVSACFFWWLAGRLSLAGTDRSRSPGRAVRSARPGPSASPAAA